VEATAPLVPPAGRCNVTAIRRAMRRVSQIYDEALALSGLRSTQLSNIANQDDEVRRILMSAKRSLKEQIRGGPLTKRKKSYA